MNTRYIKYIFAAAMMAVISILAGCSDEIEIIKPVYGNGDVELSAEVIFKPLAVTEVKTTSRTDAPLGSSFKSVNSLYVLFFNADGERIDDYSGRISDYELTDVVRPSDNNQGETTAETATPRATFKKVVAPGQYYIYAVANVESSILDAITSIEALRSIPLVWHPDDMNKNLAMFGVFKSTVSTSVDNTSFEDDVLVTVSDTYNQIHSWLRRATSKVTVAFDGSALLDDVEIYIHTARLVDVASSSYLGRSLRDDEQVSLAQSTFLIDYAPGSADHAAWPMINNCDGSNKLDKYSEQNGGALIDMHSEQARALPCYENLQGIRDGSPKLQDRDGDGYIDDPRQEEFTKDGVENGTYLEVEGYYVSKRATYKSEGPIKYRFMLGMNELNDFNVMRNHHYKITMSFKGYGNEVDWHVDYTDNMFSVDSQPKEMNYLGKYFTRNLDYPNRGHNFDAPNVITVTSFTGADNSAVFKPLKFQYQENGTGSFVDTPPAWLNNALVSDPIDSRRCEVTFSVNTAAANYYDEIDIDKCLQDNTTKGSTTARYNLADNSTNLNKITETANTYIVDAPGYYIFPLVYGNAYTKDGINSAAYTGPSGDWRYMANFDSHLNGGPITTPFIQDNSSWCKPTEATLLWQEEKSLISNVKLIPEAFTITDQDNVVHKIDGIAFDVTSIQQGNASIAVWDNNSPKQIMWSWQIWAFDLNYAAKSKINAFSDNTETTNVSNDKGNFELMNFNLGWCAERDADGKRKKVRYYPKRSCKVRIYNDLGEDVVTVVVHPHTVIPRGDNPDYQWGRKDPFPGRTTGNVNKVIYNIENKEVRKDDPERIVASDNNSGNSNWTKNILPQLIREPMKWNNPPRKKCVCGNHQFDSDNAVYFNQWSAVSGGNAVNSSVRGVTYKTVYDPCPPGYQVCHPDVFYGFTTDGWGSYGNDSYDPKKWLDVPEMNMVKDFYDEGDLLSSHIIEFYTDRTRLHSISIPINGYRDWDAKATVYEYGKKGYLWTNIIFEREDHLNNASYFEVSRYNDSSKNWSWDHGNDADGTDDDSKDMESLRVVRPSNGFYNCDGCPVRPVKY